MAHTLDAFLCKPLSNSTNVLPESKMAPTDSSAQDADAGCKRTIGLVDQIPRKRPRTMHTRAIVQSDAADDMEAMEVIEETGAARKSRRHPNMRFALGRSSTLPLPATRMCLDRYSVSLLMPSPCASPLSSRSAVICVVKQSRCVYDPCAIRGLIREPSLHLCIFTWWVCKHVCILCW